MSELAVTVLQFGLLLLLWILILSIIGAQSRDLMVSKKSRTRAGASGSPKSNGGRSGGAGDDAPGGSDKPWPDVTIPPGFIGGGDGGGWKLP